jgi:hypothetical protein
MAAAGFAWLAAHSARAQSVTPATDRVTRVASAAAGSINGSVQDEHGLPIRGALISALGATSAFGKTDRTGHFELVSLSPGPYLVRAHLSGYVASRGQIVEVRASSRTPSSIRLHRFVAAVPTPASALAASVGLPDPPQPAPVDVDPPADPPPAQTDDDHGELAWRLRHLRRSVLQEAVLPTNLPAPASADVPSSTGPARPTAAVGRALETSARAATDFFATTPFSGQLNLLATSSFDSPQQLFSGDGLPRNVTYMAFGAPVGSNADWSVRGAFTQTDLTAWVVAGAYATRGPARHHYNLGMSYATQGTETSNPPTPHLAAVLNRSAGAVYGFDTFAVTSVLALEYGTRYDRYDYLGNPNLVSPRVSVTISPASRFRVDAIASSHAAAPGAQEFLPPGDSGPWLPPQRTFSSLSPGVPLAAERTTHTEVDVERDLGTISTLSLGVFDQHTNGQLVTIFGVGMPNLSASDLGHYLVGNFGDVAARGVRAGFRTALAGRVHGGVVYSLINAQWSPGDESDYWARRLPLSAALRSGAIHDVATNIETDVPETATRVVILYRLSNAFGRRSPEDDVLLDSRFDVQVHQSLPFMDFCTAKWEMLLSVRNFLMDGGAEQSVYDELLVVRPPKRIVGGLTMRF